MAVVTTTTVNRTKMTAITTTRTVDDERADDRPTIATNGDKYVSMETILAALRRLVDRDGVDQVSEENLAAEVQTMCPQWDCPKSSDAVQLVREYLREGSLQGLCSETGTKGYWRLDRASSYQSMPANLCPEHRSALTNRMGRTINGMTKEQVFRLVCRILREDGQKYNDVYCLCNKCLNAKNGKVTRCRLPPNSKKSKHGQKNMQLLKNHRRLTEKMNAEKSKKSRKSRSKSAKNKSARSQERSKSRKSSKSKKSSKKSSSKKDKKKASKKSKDRSTSKKSKGQNKKKGGGDEIAEADGASHSKNKRSTSKKSKKSHSKKSKGSDKRRSRSKKRQSKKRQSKKANKARV